MTRHLVILLIKELYICGESNEYSNRAMETRYDWARKRSLLIGQRTIKDMRRMNKRYQVSLRVRIGAM
jgi:hypothetical protein